MRKHLSRLLFPKRKVRPAWQARRKNSAEKVALISPLLTELDCRSVLDVGCNAGEVTRQLGRQCFAVGVDQTLSLNGFENPFKGACLGEIQITVDTVGKMPKFDAVALLSVHHQWHYYHGDRFAGELVRAVAGRASRVFVIEFAAINSKYQDSGEGRFKDNDEQSVRAYGRTWLEQVLPDYEIRYLGRTIESPVEPYRFMYACFPIASLDGVKA